MAGTLVMQYYIDKVEPGFTGKVIVPSYLKPSWTGGEFVSFYLKSNNGTPYITEDDIYIQPAAGVAVKSAPLNSSADGEMNFIYDGRSNRVVFQRGATALAEITPLVSLNGRDIVRLDKPIVSGASRSFELPFQPAAGAEISVSLEYKDGSVSGAAKFTASDAPANMAEGFGNFSVKALLGQIAITNFDSGRDGYTAFASTDNGLNWKELGKISANVGHNFNITMTASSRIKLAIRDKNGNFSRTQPEGISIMPAPVNAAAGDKAFLVLGHEKKLEVDNSNGALNGFNLLYSLDGGASWSSTEAVAGEGRRKLTLPELIRSGSAVKIALLEWKTGNASLASTDYLLKSASNRLSGAVAGDFTVNTALKKVAVNNSGGALSGYTVYVNGAQAGKISADEESNAFAYESGASDEVELYYAEPGGNTWLTAKSKPVMKPRNNKITDGDFFVNAAGGKITFKNSSGKAAGHVPLVSLDGGKIWKDIGPALGSGDNEFALIVSPGDKVCAAFGDSNGNIGAASEFYNAVVPKLNAPVKMLLAGDGGADAKAGVITEAGKPALTIRPGVMLNAGESLKVTLVNGGAVTMTAKSSLNGAFPVFGGTTPGIIYEAGASGNGSAVTGSFNLNNPGGVAVAITGTVEVMAVYTDALGNTAPVAKAYIAADTVAPLWADGYPSISAPEYFKLKISLMANEDGKIYIVCLKSSEASPTAAQIKAGLNASGAAVAAGMKVALDFAVDGGALAHIFAGLDNNTEYAVYAVAEDGYENLQAQPAVVKLKTLNNVAPVWASGYPKAEAPEFFKLKFSVKNNETGSVYLLCQKSGLASLTAAQVKAGVDASGAAADSSMKAIIAMHAADSEAVHIFTGLENAVEYDIYAVAEDEYGALQANPTSVRIKTRDNTPPAWASGYPQGQPTGYTSVRLSATVDKKALIYAVCLSANAPEPSVAQVIAGKNASDIELASNLKGTVEVAANASGYINFTNLGVGTSYDIFSAAVNEYGISQTAVSKTRVSTIALVPPSFSSAETSADGTKIFVKFNKTMSSSLPAAPAGFSVTCDGSANTVTAAALNSQDKSIIELTLTNGAYANISSIKISYAAGGSAVKCIEGLSLSNFADYTVINKSCMPPVSGLSTSVADGAVTLNWVKPSGDIFDGFVISYTDITAAADPVVLAPLGNVSTHTVSGLVNGHIYTFTVKTIKTTDRTKDSAAVESRQSTPTSGPVFSGNAVEL
ncbi:MAG TPA: SwmB domain-containing protein, partial [Candidatus Wallbacteria bacterium]|nr:SwmB domain-containing protein [Candidatus Wallbacteria bacterium]